MSGEGAERRESGKPRIAHVGVHHMANDNAGDTLLFCVVRWLFESVLGDVEWVLIPVWQALSADDAERINRDCDAILIGGGGLFLADQKGAPPTPGGWQWNITVDALENFRIPLIVFAVGYNRFRGQPDFGPGFAPHVTALLRKSSFFGLRNTGSIDAIRRYVPESLWHCIRLQPCPTTVIRHIGRANYALPAGEHAIAFNAAYDRPAFRLGGDWRLGLNRLAEAMHYALERGWRVDAVAHKAIDEQFFGVLEEADIDFRAVSLSGKAPEEVISYYASVSAAVGMRGHAQMIPLGLGKPIFSAVTHDKMRFLLKDIGHPEWGHELGDTRFTEHCRAFIDQLDAGFSGLQGLACAASERLWEPTEENMRLIAKLLGTHS